MSQWVLVSQPRQPMLLSHLDSCLSSLTCMPCADVLYTMSMQSTMSAHSTASHYLCLLTQTFQIETTCLVSYNSLSLIRTGFQFIPVQSTVLCSLLMHLWTSSIFLEISTFTNYFPMDTTFIRNPAYWRLVTFLAFLSIFIISMFLITIITK